MLNVPDDFVFTCELFHPNNVILTSEVGVIIARRDKNANLRRVDLVWTENGRIIKKAIIYDLDHIRYGQGSRKEFKKGTKEFNELLELAYVKQVLK